MPKLRDLYHDVAAEACSIFIDQGYDDEVAAQMACKIADQLRRHAPDKNEETAWSEDEDENEDEDELLIAQLAPPDYMNSLECVHWHQSASMQALIERKQPEPDPLDEEADEHERQQLIAQREQLVILHLLRSEGLCCMAWRFGETEHRLSHTNEHIGRFHCLLHEGHQGPHEFAGTPSQTANGWPKCVNNDVPPDPSGDEYAPAGFVFDPEAPAELD
jgi:hypothetical protein